MSVKILSSNDDVLDQIAAVLRDYQAEHPRAKIECYRHDPYSIWVRVIDADFSSQNRVQRNDRVWNYLDRLADKSSGEIGSLVLVTPAEAKRSPTSLEFDDEAAHALTNGHRVSPNGKSKSKRQR